MWMLVWVCGLCLWHVLTEVMKPNVISALIPPVGSELMSFLFLGSWSSWRPMAIALRGPSMKRMYHHSTIGPSLATASKWQLSSRSSCIQQFCVLVVACWPPHRLLFREVLHAEAAHASLRGRNYGIVHFNSGELLAWTFWAGVFWDIEMKPLFFMGHCKMFIFVYIGCSFTVMPIQFVVNIV